MLEFIARIEKIITAIESHILAKITLKMTEKSHFVKLVPRSTEVQSKTTFTTLLKT